METCGCIILHYYKIFKGKPHFKRVFKIKKMNFFLSNIQLLPNLQTENCCSLFLDIIVASYMKCQILIARYSVFFSNSVYERRNDT